MTKVLFTICSTWIYNLEQKLCIIETVGVKYHGPLSAESTKIYFHGLSFRKTNNHQQGKLTLSHYNLYHNWNETGECTLFYNMYHSVINKYTYSLPPPPPPQPPASIPNPCMHKMATMKRKPVFFQNSLSPYSAHEFE